MSTSAPPAVATPMSTTPLPPVPDEVEQEEQLAIRARDTNIARMALEDPKKVEAYLTALQQGLQILGQVAIKSTTPYDWTKYADKQGNVICVLRDNGATTIRKWLGISITGHRGHPIDVNVPGPLVTREKPTAGATGGEVSIVEMWADGYCARTGERIEGVYSAVRSDQKFRGRETPQDDKASIRTYLDTKITRILSGLRKVPESVLKEAGIDTAKCYAGSGFGTSAERQAGAVAEEGVKEQASKLREEILRRVGGDSAAAKQLCREITKGDKPGADGKLFPGWDTTDRLTKAWQIENAWKKLKAHPTFGDDAEGREPGADG